MITPFIEPFELTKSNLLFALRLLTVSQEWRKHLNTFRIKYGERDLATLHGEHEALARARTPWELATASQEATRDYLQSRGNLWMDAMSLAMLHQSAMGEAIFDGTKMWLSGWAADARRANADFDVPPSWFNAYGLFDGATFSDGAMGKHRNSRTQADGEHRAS